VRNTPICEAGCFSAGIGAALTGMRPIVEAQASTFLYSAMDQTVNQAAKSRYMFGGEASVSIVMRALGLYTISLAAHHSDRPWGLFAQVPGLRVVVPTTPYDAKGLMKAAIRDGNPIRYLEDGTLRQFAGEIPDGDYMVPIGTADIKRVGTDITTVAVASAVHHSLAAAQKLKDEDGISAEVVDVRTAAPFDRKRSVHPQRRREDSWWWTPRRELAALPPRWPRATRKTRTIAPGSPLDVSPRRACPCPSVLISSACYIQTLMASPPRPERFAERPERFS
jgi:pyruvate dehydrogenase E1 component beta subunit